MDTQSLPRSRAEAKALGASHYFTGEPCKHGHIAPRKTKGACVECVKAETETSKEKRAEYFRQYNQSEASKKAKRSYYERNKEAVIARAQARSVEEKRLYRKRNKDNNPEYYKSWLNHRRRRFRQATPKWLTKEEKRQIRKLYIDAMTATRVTGIPYVVDHHYPLNGRTVCGLHIPSNLKIISREENLKKSNLHPDEELPFSV
jgi:hypothetical protein